MGPSLTTFPYFYLLWSALKISRGVEVKLFPRWLSVCSPSSMVGKSFLRANTALPKAFPAVTTSEAECFLQNSLSPPPALGTAERSSAKVPFAGGIAAGATAMPHHHWSLLQILISCKHSHWRECWGHAMKPSRSKHSTVGFTMRIANKAFSFMEINCVCSSQHGEAHSTQHSVPGLSKLWSPLETCRGKCTEPGESSKGNGDSFEMIFHS